MYVYIQFISLTLVGFVAMSHSPVALPYPEVSLPCHVEATAPWNGQREDCYYQKNCFIL